MTEHRDPASVHRVKWALEHPREYEQWRREHPTTSAPSFWRTLWQFLKDAW